MRITKTTSRKFEKIVGCIGSVCGIFSSLILFIFNGVGFSSMTFLGFLAIIGSILGFLASYFVEDRVDGAGFIFVVAAICLVLHSGTLGIIGAILLLIAGISALFRK